MTLQTYTEPNPDNTPIPISERPFSRRAGLAFLVAAAANRLTGCTAPDGNGDKHPEIKDGSTERFNMARMNPYDSVSPATAVADSLHITAGSYYKLTPEVVATVSDSGIFYHTTDHLAPIFFPAIHEHEDIIIEASNEFGVPPNMLASLASIESAGITEVRSGADAYGLVQVVPKYHFDKFVAYLPPEASLEDYNLARNGGSSVVPKETYVSVFTDVRNNTYAGAEYLAECIHSAEKHNPNTPKVITYALAAAAYNGGVGNTSKGYGKMKLESQLYVNHIARILLDVETAFVLEKQGLNGDEILRAMQSQKMNAIGYAYDKLPRGNDLKDYEEQAGWISKLSDLSEAPAEFRNNVIRYYEKQVSQYTAPMTPGMRIWSCGGGDSLFLGDEANKNWRLP